MEFPHHHHHHHHHRRDDDEEREPYAPPPSGTNFGVAPPPPPQPYYSEPHYAAPPPPYREGPYAPPPPPGIHFAAAPPPPSFGEVTHVHHTSGEPYPPPEHRYGGYAAPPPPQNLTIETHGGDYAGVTHVSHHQHSHQTQTASVFDHRHDDDRLPENLAGLAGRPTVKVYCKAETNFYLTIRDGKVILAPSDPSDEAQHWYKDEKFSTRVKDSEGLPCFALVNKATGEALKHSIGETQPVQLITYDPDRLDESVLWTESKDLGDGYRTIRMVNDIWLNVDAYHGDQRSGGVRDGTLIVVWKWNKGDNQRWKIVPF